MNMKSILVVLFGLLIHLSSWATIKGEPSGQPVVLTGVGEQHLVTKPTAVYNSNVTLSVELDATHYASYSVTLTSPSGRDTTVNATSATVNIPVTGNDDVFIVTVDGGGYGTYDGILSRSGASTATLSAIHQCV